METKSRQSPRRRQMTQPKAISLPYGLARLRLVRQFLCTFQIDPLPAVTLLPATGSTMVAAATSFTGSPAQAGASSAPSSPSGSFGECHAGMPSRDAT